MKKQILAAALAGVTALPVAAQVQVYGVIDQSYSRTSKQLSAGGALSEVKSGQLSSSRLGFKGTEDLGGGMKASFTVESGLATDANSTISFGDRGAEVQLSAGFGTIGIGKAVTSDANIVHTGMTNLSNLGTSLTGTRPNNRIQYITPSFNGFTANVAIGYGESTASAQSKNGDYQSFGATYASGPLRIVAFQAESKLQTAASDAVNAWCTNGSGGVLMNNATSCTGNVGFTNTVVAGSAAVAAQDGKNEDTGFLLGYNFGIVNATIRHLESKRSGTVTTAVDTTATGVDLLAPLGNGMSVGVAYTDYSVDGTTASDDFTKSTVWLVKDLSKRTNVYAAFQRTSNDAGASTNVNAAYAGQDSSLYSIGVRHSF